MDVLSQNEIDSLIKALLYNQDCNTEIEIIEGSKEYEIAIRFKNLSPDSQRAVESALESFELDEVKMRVRRTKTSLPSGWAIVE